MKKILFAVLLVAISSCAVAQDKKVTRIARITVDSLQLTSYQQLLKEQMETAVKLEPGVISYEVYAAKTSPYKLTIVEVYASNEAYLAHRETEHFKKYKGATKDMVKSLELAEVSPVLSAKKK
ncbi:MAG: putative quinol monooxygenase [Chitinophagaceae bacterium]